MTVPRWKQLGLQPPVHREPRRAVVVGAAKPKPPKLQPKKKQTPMRVLTKKDMPI